MMSYLLSIETTGNLEMKTNSVRASVILVISERPFAQESLFTPSVHT